jgi:hypothetical protein
MQPLIIDVSRNIGAEYVPLVHDLARTVIIQLLVQMLLAAVDDSVSFLSAEFVLVLLYVLLGVAAYHLLLKRVVRIE